MRVCCRMLRGEWCKVGGCKFLSLVLEFLSEMTPIQLNDMINSLCRPWLQLVKMAILSLLYSGYYQLRLSAITRCNRGLRLPWLLCCTYESF